MPHGVNGIKFTVTDFSSLASNPLSDYTHIFQYFSDGIDSIATGGGDTWRPIQVNGSQVLDTSTSGAINFSNDDNNNVKFSYSNNTIMAKVELGSEGYVRYDAAQSLTTNQKTQARTNIGAGTSNFTGYTASNKLSTNYINNVAGWTAVTESTVNSWGFTKNTGTVTSVDSVSPSSGNVALSAVRYVSQSLTNAQKTQARTNIGAGTSNFTGYTSSNKLSTDYINNVAGGTSNIGTVTSVNKKSPGVNGNVTIGVGDISGLSDTLTQLGNDVANRVPLNAVQPVAASDQTKIPTIAYVDNMIGSATSDFAKSVSWTSTEGIQSGQASADSNNNIDITAALHEITSQVVRNYHSQGLTDTSQTGGDILTNGPYQFHYVYEYATGTGGYGVGLDTTHGTGLPRFDITAFLLEDGTSIAAQRKSVIALNGDIYDGTPETLVTDQNAIFSSITTHSSNLADPQLYHNADGSLSIIQSVILRNDNAATDYRVLVPNYANVVDMSPWFENLPNVVTAEGQTLGTNTIVLGSGSQKVKSSNYTITSNSSHITGSVSAAANEVPTAAAVHDAIATVNNLRASYSSGILTLTVK